MATTKYCIKTLDGHVVRKVATRPYVAGFVNRQNGTVTGFEMTTQPKHIFGTKWEYNYRDSGYDFTYEELVAIPIETKGK